MTSTDNPNVLPDLIVLAAERSAAHKRHLAEQEAAREQARREHEAGERTAVERDAHDMVGFAFMGTLAQVVTRQMWQGYPSVDRPVWGELQPTAVAYLGGNTFLHYTATRTDEYVMTLLQPCTTCGARLEHRLWDDLELSVCLGSEDAPATCRDCATSAAARPAAPDPALCHTHELHATSRKG
ncbi:hypothetical protein [Streptomyces sp. NPDC059008]|uniref:hypothetical protein n=1 Tax=Streptomyces sp. NPDC059008 TaxID=3346693 RepID=UPI00367F67C6